MIGDRAGLSSSNGHITLLIQQSICLQHLWQHAGLPVPLFEVIGDLINFGFLLLIKYRKPFQGFLFLQLLALYSTLRFTLEFWRGDSLRTLLNLKVAQLTALVMNFLAIGFMFGRYRQMKAAHRE
ncbi:MAG: prolipoprotein diacylglyceryl transferase family protein [Sporolactobacillus sp.]